MWIQPASHPVKNLGWKPHDLLNNKFTLERYHQRLPKNIPRTPGCGKPAKPSFWNTTIPLGKQICISFSGTWLNLEESPSEGLGHMTRAPRPADSSGPRLSACWELNLSVSEIQNLPFKSSATQTEKGSYFISNTLLTLKTGFRVIKDPFIFQFQWFFFQFVFCLFVCF